MAKKTKLFIALLSALSLLVTGTFAFQQIATFRNEFWGTHDDTTLHDDFDPGTGKKDVYVENTGSTNLLIRVKLDEAMNLNSYTWRPTDGSSDWITHTYINDITNCDHKNHLGSDKFHEYFTWAMGGQKYYMPAKHLEVESNKNKVVHDLKEYIGDETYVKQTPFAKMILMAEFLALNPSEQKDFMGWVCDTDGYAYWSQILPAGEATGLLLNRVATDTSKLKDMDYYYAINVIMEAIDRKDAPMWLEGAESIDGSKATHNEATNQGKEFINILLINNPDDDNNGTPSQPATTTTPATTTDPGNGNGSGGTDTDPEEEPEDLTLAVKPPADPDLGYRSHISEDPSIDEGGWFTIQYRSKVLEHEQEGLFRLSEILVDNNYDGLKVEALDSKYKDMFKIGTHEFGNYGILYRAMPDYDTMAIQHVEDENTLYPVTTMLRLTQGNKSVDIKVTMEYYWANLSWD